MHLLSLKATKSMRWSLQDGASNPSRSPVSDHSSSSCNFKIHVLISCRMLDHIHACMQNSQWWIECMDCSQYDGILPTRISHITLKICVYSDCILLRVERIISRNNSLAFLPDPHQAFVGGELCPLYVRPAEMRARGVPSEKKLNREF